MEEKYKLEISNNSIEHVTKDGHIMFIEDVVKDLNNNHSLTEDKFALGEGCKNDNGLQSSSDQVANTPIKEVKIGCGKVVTIEDDDGNIDTDFICGMNDMAGNILLCPFCTKERGCRKVWFGKDQLEHYCGYDCLCEECKVLEQMNLYLAELKKALERNDYGFAELINKNFGKYLESLK